MARLTDQTDESDAARAARPEGADQSGELESATEPDHSLRYVLTGVVLVSVLVGVFAYWRYAQSERWVADGIARMDELGASVDAEQCIDEAVEWYGECDQHQANAAVCLQGVGILMQHCLAARERDATCELYLDPESAIYAVSEKMRERARNPDKAGESGRWVYARCEERDMVCLNKRECACAEAYRAIDSFCRTGQQAVQL